MKISEIVSISGMPGLYKIAAPRPDGLIVQPFDSDVTKFISSRIHMFTTLDNITIYTDDEPEELINVLMEMKNKAKEHPPADVKGDGDQLKAYFKEIVPSYDEERVYVSDIKKVIKWYNVLDQHKVLNDLERADQEEAVDEVEEGKAEKKAEAPEKKKTVKKESKEKKEPVAKKKADKKTTPKKTTGKKTKT